LLILGILVAVAVPRYIELEVNANQRAIDTAISDLNGRESLTWASQKVSPTGYVDDQQVFNAINYNFGSHYTWTVPPDEFGGTLEFKGISVAINRTPSTAAQPDFWRR